VHAHDAADALLLAFGCIINIGAALHDAGVIAEERQRTDERVGCDLEGKAGERFFVFRFAVNFSPVFSSCL
jgi:hypothetical protein